MHACRSTLEDPTLPWFAELNRSLNDELDDAQFRARIQASTQQLRTLAAEMLARATGEHPLLDGSALRAALAERDDTPAPAELLAEFA